MKLYLIFLLSLMAIALGDGEENPSGDEIEVEEEVLVLKDVNFDADDESLADDGGLNVAVDKMSIVIDGRKDIDLDLTGDLAKLKDFPVIMKEGVSYRIKITFQVKRKIVVGLRYHQVTDRKGISVDKSTIVVGSYGPKPEAQEFLTPPEEAPKGMLARGSYTAKSRFIDDDKICYLQWEWRFDIKKDWD